MTDQRESFHSPEPLDELATELLEVGAVLSQIVGRMVEFQAAGRSAPDATPIPEVAHALIKGVLDGVRKQHSKRDIRVAATIVAQATHAITENIFYVGPELN
jgi:hypothetical protein